MTSNDMNFAVFLTKLVCLLINVCSGISFDVDAAVFMIETSMGCRSTPGLAVALVKDGQVLLSRGFGITDVVNRASVTSETLFGVSSLTKSFTATLMVKLLNETPRLTVNSRVGELFSEGEFQMADELRTKETTFADLLSHRTAVPFNNRIRYDTNLTRENLLKRIALLPSPFQFRTDYVYNNLMYGVLVRLSEIIGQDRWEHLISQHFFQALGMSRSSFASTLDFEHETNLAQPYLESDGHYHRLVPEFSRRWAELPGSDSIMSTANDMAKWLNFQLDGVISSVVLSELHKPHMVANRLPRLGLTQPTFPVTFLPTDYAFGFRTGHYRGYEMLIHHGSTVGYNALMTMLPDAKVGVVTLANGQDRHFLQRTPIHTHLLDVALGLDPWLNETTICSFPEPWTDKPNVNKSRPEKDFDAVLRLDIPDYEGLYHNDAYGDMTIEYNDTLDSLTMSYGFGKWELLLFHRPNATREKFAARAMTSVNPFDVKPIYFVMHPRHNDVIVGVNASGFERRVAPIFCRTDYREDCLEAIFNVQPYNVGKCKRRGCNDSTNGVQGNRLRSDIILHILLFVLLYLSQTKYK